MRAYRFHLTVATSLPESQDVGLSPVQSKSIRVTSTFIWTGSHQKRNTKVCVGCVLAGQCSHDHRAAAFCMVHSIHLLIRHPRRTVEPASEGGRKEGIQCLPRIFGTTREIMDIRVAVATASHAPDRWRLRHSVVLTWRWSDQQSWLENKPTRVHEQGHLSRYDNRVQEE